MVNHGSPEMSLQEFFGIAAEVLQLVLLMIFVLETEAQMCDD